MTRTMHKSQLLFVSLSAMMLALSAPAWSQTAADPRDQDDSAVMPMGDPEAGMIGFGSTVGDNLGNHQGTMTLQMNDNDIDMGEGEIIFDGGTILGLPLLPNEDDEAASKAYVDSQINSVTGDVSNLANREVIAGDGLSGGGPLTANVTLNVDGSVVRTSGNQTIGGDKSFSNSVHFLGNRVLGVAFPVDPFDGVNRAYVDNASNVLSQDINDLSTEVNDLENRILTAGDGLTGGGSLVNDLTFAVDHTVVRTTGVQIIGGNKSFTGQLNFSDQPLRSVGNPVLASDAATRSYVDGRVINAGVGLTGGGNLASNPTIDLASDQIRRPADSSLPGVLAFNGQNPQNGEFHGGSINPLNSTTRLNYNGDLYSNRFFSNAYFYFSDENLKKNISGIAAAEGTSLLRQVRPVRYDWSDDGQHALGVIAQEMAMIMPETVNTDPETGLMSVDYIQLIAPVIASIQDLDARLASLEHAVSN